MDYRGALGNSSSCHANFPLKTHRSSNPLTIGPSRIDRLSRLTSISPHREPGHAETRRHGSATPMCSSAAIWAYFTLSYDVPHRIKPCSRMLCRFSVIGGCLFLPG